MLKSSTSLIAALSCGLLSGCFQTETQEESSAPLTIESLEDLSIQTLRKRNYQAEFSMVTTLSDSPAAVDYVKKYSADGTIAESTKILSYQSDGLRLYARIDIPSTPAPEKGHPVLVFNHGWIGAKDAPSYDFGYNPNSLYGEIIDRFVDLGYLVITPGYRGHGTYLKTPADGHEFMTHWDNATLLSPSFYTIDVLNLIAAIPSLDTLADLSSQPIDLTEFNMLGHSQGGDVTLGVMAALGEGKQIGPTLNASSIWAGCIHDRFTQSELYGPMANSAQAFMNGDGQWNGTGTGVSGKENTAFVFGYPQDWIGTVDTHSEDWTWQRDTFGKQTVAGAIEERYETMYNLLRNQVSSLAQLADFTMPPDWTNTSEIQHPKALEALNDIGGYHHTQWLSEPLNLHFSDQDYYSPPAWNFALANRLKGAGFSTDAFVYQHNTHSLKVSQHQWFSPPGTVAGIDQAVTRDHELFKRSVK